MTESLIKGGKEEPVRSLDPEADGLKVGGGGVEVA